MKSLSHVQYLATPWTAAYQAPPSMGFSRQEYWSGLPLPSPLYILRQLQVAASCPTTASCRIPLTFSWRADLVITNSLSFLLSGNTLLPLRVLKASFVGYKIPEDVVFFFPPSFSTLNILTDKKYVENLIANLLCGTSYLSLAVFKILFIFDF